MQKKLILASGAFAGLLVGCGPPMAADKEPAPPVVQEPAFEAKVAEVGDGVRGKSLQNEQGISKIIAAPAVTLFTVREKAVFQIQIPHAMQLFNGLEGRNPKSHEEFMEKIVDFNKIPLPELPKGRVYRYHPDDGQLWVEPEETKPAQ